MADDVRYDVGVIGGGPAGATVAAYLARAGLKVAVFEASVFPREHVGESLVPAVIPVMRDIGVIGKVEAAGFPRKYGAAWTSADHTPTSPLDFHAGSHGFGVAEIGYAERDQAGVHQDYVWHVDRGAFDLILLKHAEELGAAVFSGVRVQRVDFSAPERPVLQVSVGGVVTPIPVRMVVDASGRQTQLGSLPIAPASAVSRAVRALATSSARTVTNSSGGTEYSLATASASASSTLRS